MVPPDNIDVLLRDALTDLVSMDYGIVDLGKAPLFFTTRMMVAAYREANSQAPKDYDMARRELATVVKLLPELARREQAYRGLAGYHWNKCKRGDPIVIKRLPSK